MLEIDKKISNWSPPVITEEYVDEAYSGIVVHNYNTYDWIHFIRTDPYIDILYFKVRDKVNEDYEAYRFVFHEGYYWDLSWENEFEQQCIKSDYPILFKSSEMDHIFEYYSSRFPGWHLKRYRMHSERLLDHIYHCIKKNTIKELLYKAGVDELAVRAPKPHEVNLLASSPSEIYDGVPNRVIRAINTECGAELLSQEKYREFLKKLNSKYPEVFKEPLNDAQCRYLMRLKDGDLTWDEIYRLFVSSKKRLACYWNRSQFIRFLCREEANKALYGRAKDLIVIDSFYEKYIPKVDREQLAELVNYLLDNRDKLDKAIRRANRKRPEKWQERDSLYVVRYPQTVNDFCKEALYMSNCLMTYLEAFIENETDILFLRKADDANVPFITMEIYKDRLWQAYHRFNKDCTPEEAEWIRAYCRRHGIDHENYAFDWDIDRQ